jgi:hypothetical protein
MPVAPGASDKTREKNIATEIATGKYPVKQAVAIGYSEQRAAKKRKKTPDWSKARA